MCKRLITIHFLILFLVASAGHAHSADFAIMQQGTGPMGQGNAFVAQAGDPSALFFNPAGISQLEGNQAYLGSTIIVPRLKYNGPTYQEEKTVAKVFVPQQVYLTQQVLPQIYFGFGVFSPFGLGTYWDGDWEVRYLTTCSNMETVNLNPNLAFKKGESGSISGIQCPEGRSHAEEEALACTFAGRRTETNRGYMGLWIQSWSPLPHKQFLAVGYVLQEQDKAEL